MLKSREDLISAISEKPQEAPAVVGSDGISGEVLFPLTKGFEDARTAIWNKDTAGMPVVIVKCANANDVSAAISFAKDNSLKISIHTAGAHSGHAVVDDSVVIDLSMLRGVLVDENSKTVTVAGGATIGDVDRATKPYGLALPMGHVHHTGVAGMVLNATSGVGFLGRTRGLAASYLQAATMVMADGTIKRISKSENNELLWAIRGAGSNFGVAIEMVFSLTSVSPKVYSGDLVKFGKGTGPGKLLCCINSKQTREELVMKYFSFFSEETTPEECSALLVLAPRGPVISRICYIPKESDALLPESQIHERGEKAFKSLADYGFTLSNTVKMDDYWDGLQKMGEFKPSYYYQKGITAASIPEDKLPSVVDELCYYATTCPVNNMGTGIIIMPLGGELSRTKPGTVSTEYAFQRLKWWIIIITEFPKGPKKIKIRQQCVQWVRDVYKVVEPFALRDEGRQRDHHSEVYGDMFGSMDAFEKLNALKIKYDPGNIFSLNRNIASKKEYQENDEKTV